MLLTVILLLFCTRISYIEGSKWQPVEVSTDSVTELNLTSMPQVLCFKVPDTFDWPVYMLRDLLVIFNLKASDIEYVDEIRPISSVFTVTVREMLLEQLPDKFSDVSALCSRTMKSTDNSFSFSQLSSIFSPSAPDLSKTLTTVNEDNYSIPAFPTPCLVFCRGIDQPMTRSLKLSVNVTSFFNEMNVIKSILGVLILCVSDHLSQTISFYYFSGVSITVLGSLLIVIIVFLRMLPLNRSSSVLQGLFILIGGTFSLSCMLFDYVRASIYDLLVNNADYTMLYVITVGLLSFVFLYWFHIPDRLIEWYPRTLVVMKYTLRFIGSWLLIYSLYLPFDETRWGQVCLMYISSLFDSQTDPSQAWSRTMTSFASKVVRIFLILCVVLLVDLLECWRPNSRSHRRRKRKSGFFIPEPDDQYPSVTVLPGLPWASSSPYDGNSTDSSYYQSKKNRSERFSPGFNNRPPNGTRLSGIAYNYRKADRYDRRSFSPYVNGYRHKPTVSYDLLTDDEDD